jgi:hypothetical protein
MKKMSLLLLFFVSIECHAIFNSDSLASKKRTRKNLFEVGGSAALFFNRQPMSYQSDGWLAWIPIRMEATSPLIPSYIKYARKIGQKTMVGISSYSFGESYDTWSKLKTGEAKKGELLAITFSDITLSFDYFLKEIRISKEVMLNTYILSGLSYRWGEEWVYLSQNMFGDADLHLWVSGTTVLDLGTGANADVVLGNRLYIGGFLGYTHYFEKSRLPKDDPDYFDTYRPNRDVLRLHPKIGVLF